jgi:folate-binding Fe-S cluster repair protein YgfZ
VSYTKGCYTGQETVARVHFRGHVNRLLRGLRFPAGTAVPSGATILRADGTIAGDVRSVASSPRLGEIGLGLIRREVEPMSELMAQWESGARSATVQVRELPFES